MHGTVYRCCGWGRPAPSLLHAVFYIFLPFCAPPGAAVCEQVAAPRRLLLPSWMGPAVAGCTPFFFFCPAPPATLYALPLRMRPLDSPEALTPPPTPAAAVPGGRVAPRGSGRGGDAGAPLGGAHQWNTGWGRGTRVGFSAVGWQPMGRGRARGWCRVAGRAWRLRRGARRQGGGTPHPCPQQTVENTHIHTRTRSASPPRSCGRRPRRPHQIGRAHV